jgi:hypothetical protein
VLRDGAGSFPLERLSQVGEGGRFVLMLRALAPLWSPRAESNEMNDLLQAACLACQPTRLQCSSVLDKVHTVVLLTNLKDTDARLAYAARVLEHGGGLVGSWLQRASR